MFVKSSVIEDTVVVEAKSKVALLSRITNLCTAVCKHGLSDTVNQGNVANLNVAFDHMVFDVEPLQSHLQEGRRVASTKTSWQE